MDLAKITTLLGAVMVSAFLLHAPVFKRWRLYSALLLSVALVLVGGTYFKLDLSELGIVIDVWVLVFAMLSIALIVAVYDIVRRNIRLSSLFTDSRTSNFSRNELFKEAFLRIPVSTVLIEEVLFRGLALGVLMSWLNPLYAVIYSSVLFGLWHIVPALSFNKLHPVASSSPVGTVAVTVVATFAAGCVFGWLRVWSGSLLLPVAVHLSINSGGLIINWLGNSNHE